MKKAKSSSRTPGVIETAVRNLRGAIMRGDLRPGQKLVEADLCRDLAISRASLREALRALEAERLIELVPNRGPSVAKLGTKEIEDIHDLWALLTGEVVARFTAQASAKDLAAIDAITTRVRQGLRAKNPIEQLDATNSFFQFITAHCGNEVLAQTVYQLVSRINFLRAQSLLHEGWSALCSQEIDAIVATIRTKKPAAARQATQRHIQSACDAATHVALLPKPAVSAKEATHIKRGRGVRWYDRAGRAARP